jgi:diguanylate cyclase (GGDEF)-like protein
VDLEKENARLQQALKKLLTRLEDNQRINEHFQSYELKLLGSKSFPELLELLLDGAVEHFKLDAVGLILVDTDYSLKGVLDYLNLSQYGNRLQLRHSEQFAENLYSKKYAVSLGELDALTSSRLFPNLKTPGSAALLPLVRNDYLMGSLHFGSSSKERFSEGKGADFLEFLASITAACIEAGLAREHLRYQSQVDMLTQVRNRMSFDVEFSKELERSQRNRTALTCLFVDVDHFKSINDHFGHSSGDLCLKQVAESINEQLRKTDLLARYGGEEFVVLLPNCAEEAGLMTAERIRVAIEQLGVDYLTGDQSISLTVSIGLSCWVPLDDVLVDLPRLGQRLLNGAEEAMYEAKNSGRNRVGVKPFYQLVE